MPTASTIPPASTAPSTDYPGFSYENVAHYGWHGLNDSSDDEHTKQTQVGLDHADLVTNVPKEKLPIEAGQPTRKGTEY